MSKLTNTVAAVTAAAAVGGGALLYFGVTDPETGEPVIDDVEAVAVAIPQVALPVVALPGVAAVTVAMPTVDTVRLFSLADLSGLVDATELPDLSELLVTQQLAPSIAVPAVADPTVDVPRMIAHQKRLRSVFCDQRNVQYDPGLGLYAAAWPKWQAIYEDAALAAYVPEYKALAPGLRIINEVRCPSGAEEFAVLQERLDYYAGRGYNAALVAFDTTESVSMLAAACDYIRSIGLKVVITYSGGRENLHDSVFRDPDKIRAFLAALAPKADALLLGWRRTSLHLFLPDQPFTNFLIRSARSANPEIPFIGQAYFGQTADTNMSDAYAGKFGVTCVVPENAAAVLIVGLGYPKASTRKALLQLFPEVAGHPHKIGLVVGDRPYFDTAHSTGKSPAENDRIKRRIEIRLQQAGFESTMTYSGDGSNGNYDKTRTENLCQHYGTK